MKLRHASPSVLAAALALSGCAAAASSPAAGTPASSPSAAGSPSAAAAQPSASAPPCTTHSCIVADAKSALVGQVAKDESVVTRLTCYSTSVRNPDPGIYTVNCVASYSDGSQWDGVASVLLAKGQVTWEATEEVQ
jgi:hypothetical protein